VSLQTVELVGRVFDQRLEPGDPEWAALFDPDAGWDLSAYPLPDFPDTGSGRDALTGHLGTYLSGWNDYESPVLEMLDGGEEVVVVLHERARMRTSGAVLERELHQVFTVGRGTITRFRVFETRHQALAAAGLDSDQPRV